MTQDQEAKLKEMAHQDYVSRNSAKVPYAGDQCGQALRSDVGELKGQAGAFTPTASRRRCLTERIQSQRQAAEDGLAIAERATGTESLRAAQLHQLQYLLEKNPDVADILDLMHALELR